MANVARDGPVNNIFAPKRETEENKYHQRYNIKKRIVGIHQECGGNIVKQEQCTWCEKCMKYFCGCVSK